MPGCNPEMPQEQPAPQSTESQKEILKRSPITTPRYIAILPELQTYKTQYEKPEEQADWKNFKDYIPKIQEIFRNRGLPKDLVYMAFAESNCKIDRDSPSKKAVGPFQITEETAERWGLKVVKDKKTGDISIDERKDPLRAAFAVAEIVSEIYDKTYTWTPRLTDESHRWGWAMLGYNLGSDGIKEKYTTCRGHIGKYIKDPATPEEQKNYLQKFYAAKDVLSQVELEPPTEIFGTPLVYKKQNPPKPYTVKQGDSLDSISKIPEYSEITTMHRIIAYNIEQNPNFKPNVLTIGQVIPIPQPPTKTIIFNKIIEDLGMDANQIEKFKKLNQHLGPAITDHGRGIPETTIYFTTETQRLSFCTNFADRILPQTEASQSLTDTNTCFVEGARRRTP